ncbi:lipoprotein-releasing ABC transporter permease subunit [Nitratidesulfovibrio sp. SRB-5]|uniref:lipoprotein-releasing ABC transporter permease subunit n=1 Tax=Nitratidesulfovibrio sp. SRB-5 TaxID=2872636 RepID=UPI001026209A|nr:lipoprotein-releasing ABC transporter permease subunit [Nitratidesulfovibrio sp. SRB-5]MBZ2171169.1 lipoprotein-releasing ABC transporter permease subunit [Nitratidesulfovibrio sp. SRB-5]RXF76700.1 lipoprotein-releasing ABC transporter permease subunit [Desulfovibrio sp. DS-1]
MSFELFVALRYLFARRRQTFISVISVTSILGVALGVASLIVVLGVMNGFTTDLRDKILGANAHGIVMSADRSGLGDAPQLIDKIRQVDGVRGATPFIYSEVMLSTPHGVKGLVLRGIDPQSAPSVLGILSNMTKGSVADLAPRAPASGASEGGILSGPPGVIIGDELAQRLGVVVGSRVNLLSPAGQKTSAGFAPRIRPFMVVGVFSTGMFEYDSSLGFVSLDAARDVLGLPEGAVSGVELAVTDVYKADQVAERVTRAVGGYPLYTRHWMEMNANLFAALKLEKTAMAVILVLIVLVGSFSIITTLVMLVMEKTRDIAILMSMGATRGMIRRIFMLQGTVIGAIGTGLGYVLGLGVAELLKRYQFIKLPHGVYSLDHLPVLLQWPDMLAIGASSMLLCFVATIYPARQAASLEPAEALRYE